MNEKFPGIRKITYEGPATRTALAFRYYNPDEPIAGKTMREHLKFAISWWHTLGAGGADMFGAVTQDRKFGAADSAELPFAKVDAGFELMEKLDIDYFCFHDYDLIDEAPSLAESN